MWATRDRRHDLAHLLGIEVHRHGDIDEIEPGRELLGDEYVCPLGDTAVGDIALYAARGLSPEDFGQLVATLALSWKKSWCLRGGRSGNN
jgi:hypothetical protein